MFLGALFTSVDNTKAYLEVYQKASEKNKYTFNCNTFPCVSVLVLGYAYLCLTSFSQHWNMQTSSM